MRKIVFALDNNHLCDTAFSFIRRINEQEPVMVAGMYIPDLMKELQWAMPGGEDAFYIPRLIDEDETLVRGNVISFKEACAAHHIRYQLHSDPGRSILQAIKKETRFADLIIIGLDSYYRNGRFSEEELNEIIEYSECPVLLVPKDAAFPETIIAAYDGSEDSVYALKMFTYLFPSLCNQPTRLVYADTHVTELPDELYIRELASRHFSNFSYAVLDFDPRKYFVTWMEERPKPMLIAGAFGRSEFSKMLRKSFIHDLLKEHPVPVFIASRN